MTIEKLQCVYLVFINLLTFIAFGIDKLKAKLKWWRIPEKILLLLCLFGGFIGGWLAMILFQHKIKDRSFLPYMILNSIIWFIVICLLLP